MKVASASLIGTTVEYYDFFIYGTAAALVFPKLFFPNTSPLIGALLSFATLGVGFLARPVGGVVFGHFGDRVGRKKMLVISLVTMGVATTLMGLMPSYAVIGIAAPILLTLLRLVQGFAVGGEWGGATLMAVEHAPPGRRGFFGAFPQMGAPAGVGLATIAFYLVSQLDPAAVPGVGMADPVPAQRRARARRPGDPAQHRREPGVREGPRSRGRGQDAHRRGVPPAPEGDLPRRRHLPQPGRARLHHHVLPGLLRDHAAEDRAAECPHGRLRRRGRRHGALPGVRLAGRPLGPQDDLPAGRRAHAGRASSPGSP